MGKRKWLGILLMLYVVLGSWKGYLAVFEGEDPEPRQIYPKQVLSLPEQDQAQLEEGILIRNPRRLRELLETYLS